MKYLIYEKKKRDEHYYREFQCEDDIRTWIFNTLDCSKEWEYCRVAYLLESHKAISDKNGFDYEFIYEDDIVNNNRAFQEILDLITQMLVTAKDIENLDEWTKGFLEEYIGIREISERDYYELLGSVPPIKQEENGFIVGECVSGSYYTAVLEHREGKYASCLIDLNKFTNIDDLIKIVSEVLGQKELARV